MCAVGASLEGLQPGSQCNVEQVACLAATLRVHLLHVLTLSSPPKVVLMVVMGVVVVMKHIRITVWVLYERRAD